MRKTAAYFNVGDPILYGKFKNSKGTVSGFGDDGKGNPTVKVKPNSGGPEKTIKLFQIWKVKEAAAERVADLVIASKVAARILK